MPSNDIEKRREAGRRHYAKHKEKVKTANADVKRGIRARWDAYKSTLACTQCGENHPAALDFHHVIRDPSNRKVYELVANGAIKLAMEEVKKCVVLCANCHRKGHWYERNGVDDTDDAQKLSKYFKIGPKEKGTEVPPDHQAAGSLSSLHSSQTSSHSSQSSSESSYSTQSSSSSSK